MHRLTKIVLKNWFRLPALTYKLYTYSRPGSKRTRLEQFRVVQRIVERTKVDGNLEIKVFGRENIPKQDGYIFYPNHQGIFDGFAMIEACQKPISAVMKKELMSIPFVKQIFMCMNAVAIDRGNTRQSMRVMQEVTRQVQNGANFVIFPEGTRSRMKNQMIEFKSGSFKAATKAKCPIIPVALIDSYKPFDNNETGFVTVQIHILKPFLYEDYKDWSTTKIAEKTKAMIAKTIAEYE